METGYISEEKAKGSVVFQKEKNTYFQEEEVKNKVNTDFNSEQSTRCKELSTQIKNLVGKPLRRTAAREQYKLECSN